MEAKLNGSAAVDTVFHTVLDVESSMSYLQFALHLVLQQRCGVSRVTSKWQILKFCYLCRQACTPNSQSSQAAISLETYHN